MSDSSHRWDARAAVHPYRRAISAAIISPAGPIEVSPPFPSVPRDRLLDRLDQFHGGVLIVDAPPGYGKTTLLRQWVALQSRPVRWLTPTPEGHDLTELLGPLEVVVPPPCPPVILVVDDVHHLEPPAAGDVLAELVAQLPDGSTLVLAGRTCPPLRLGRRRVEHGLLELGATDLAMDELEAETLFRSAGLALAPDRIERLLAVTEGWPAALRLAADQIALSDTPDAAAAAFAGDERWIGDYLREELLDDLDDEIVATLRRSSPVARLTGPLVDAVAGRTGSEDLLRELSRTNRLVVGLDHRGEWFRLHRLLGEHLRAELNRSEPELAPLAHLRASEWHLARGDIDEAVAQSVRGGDLRRAGAMMVANVWSRFSAGRGASIAAWLAPIADDQLAAQSSLALAAAIERFGADDGVGAAHWLSRAEAAAVVPSADVALLRALVGPSDVGDMADDARTARAGVAQGDAVALSCLLAGSAAFMAGDTEEAEHLLELSVTQARRASPGVLALGLAHRSIIELERGRWDEATGLARRGRDVLADHGLEDVASFFLVTAMSCLAEARAGRPTESDADRRRTLSGLDGLRHVAVWAGLQARIAMARASLILGRRAEARQLIDECEHLLDRVPAAIVVKEQVAELRRSLVPARDGFGWRLASLTAAERRVLQHLPTNLTLADIAERLFVSRNTVKTQAIAIYRKLGAASRGEAVSIARESGMLDDPTRIV